MGCGELNRQSAPASCRRHFLAHCCATLAAMLKENPCIPGPIIWFAPHLLTVIKQSFVPPHLLSRWSLLHVSCAVFAVAPLLGRVLMLCADQDMRTHHSSSFSSTDVSSCVLHVERGAVQ